MSKNQAPLGPPSDPAIAELRRAITKACRTWKGEPGYLVYELLLAAATITRIAGLKDEGRRRVLSESLAKALDIQNQREAESRDRQTDPRRH